jgi:hypothetical protein
MTKFSTALKSHNNHLKPHIKTPHKQRTTLKDVNLAFSMARRLTSGIIVNGALPCVSVDLDGLKRLLVILSAYTVDMHLCRLIFQ